jgi:hypothetical protein
MNPSKLWQIVLVTDLNADFSDQDNTEVAEMQGSRNDIVEASDIALAAAYAHQQLVAAAEEHRNEFFDEEAPIEYKTEPNEAGDLVITAKIDGDLFAEATIYPVTVIKLPVT